MKEGIILQVLICTYGNDGIERVAKGSHPHMPEVEYLVSWQGAKATPIPEALIRDDFKIYRTGTTGLSKNRNHALSKAEAPILLISDDDVVYNDSYLHSVIESFRSNPDTDIITFKYESSQPAKRYPSEKISLSSPPKGFFISSIEIAFRRDAVQRKVWFNENFGIGATFPSGEEDLFIKDCLAAGLKGIYLPVTMARHDAPTTSERNLSLASRPQTKGAVFMRLHPHTWPLRMLAHALREIPLWRKGLVPSPFSFCLNWIKGAVKATRLKVFPTPDYSSKYL